jgi:hypothetical protein
MSGAIAWSINGRAVIEASIHLVRRGQWHADIDLEGAENDLAAFVRLVGTDSITGETVTLAARVVSADAFKDRLHILLIGGLGNGDAMMTPRSFRRSSGAAVLAAITSTMGIILSSSSSARILTHVFERYSIPEVNAATALDLFAHELGGVWRYTEAGEVWIGDEVDSPEAKSRNAKRVASAFVVVDRVPVDFRWVVVAELPLPRPGQYLDDLIIGRVAYEIEATTCRAVVDCDITGPTQVHVELDTMKRDFVSAVGSAMRWTDSETVTLYPCTVTSATSSTVDVTPDDARIAGLASVPLIQAIAGVTATPSPGARALLGFARDMGTPFAILTNATASSLSIEATTSINVSAAVVVVDASSSIQLAPGVPPSPVLRVSDVNPSALIGTGNLKVLA